ncbi:MAG TPA: phosphotransferase [Candidatus Dormibacteraeota bacterium]|nr:phosphotransferase [Candidatus Dormibacteraeota bacterium]
MKAPPAGLDETALSALVAGRWRLDVESISYEPVGGGSHHWLLRTADAGYRFLTVDDLGTKPWLGADHDSAFAGLDVAFATARRLRDSGLDFVVAPIPAAGGDVVTRVDERFSGALFPYIAGRPGTFGAAFSLRDRAELCDIWARLHLATTAVRDEAPRRSLDVPGRADLDGALEGSGGQWSGGPYSERVREWLTTKRELVTGALNRYDRLAVPMASRELVITHGEPHAGNLIRIEEGLRLIDWDTVALAAPERDLWMLDDGTDAGLAPYTAATGHAIDRSALDFYRLAWLVTDVASFVAELRGPHAGDANSAHAWRALQVTGESLSSML